MEKNESEHAVEIKKDECGKRYVQINNIIFRGKQNIDWKAVEVYLRRYIGEIIEVADERFYINRSFTDEYTNSDYTKKLRGGLAKVKANAVQGIMEMLKIASLKRAMQNKKEKHRKDAPGGWKYYCTRFAIPVYHEKNQKVTYNFYSATLIMRCSRKGKMYLYDMQEIKKETSKPSAMF